ncbi:MULTISPECIES: PIN domain-containing protein [unclassified Tenacibaculum]|uniref:PIN domain-containing protein n=1 Tax=unclassified Tenacibaculum TaxID=2635139 RepID=UPI001F185CAD|nr:MULTISPECIES: PIN domain-containing protein [unclassified Tenacibaculum]MCF2874788.1 PIN domain-containing protein [Tenacibaculum sp. Cn5-1]MCF2934146.1 PIN domain-containing protein [Tenacibaculum sp. Cn5-34]MCG7510356.1 PIN domain-containing protein [Tenacibaculum sp. Cn5-46]
MDIIFIDTSIFESNNFLESKRIKEVYKLAERGDIKIVLPELTYDEIVNRIFKNILEASLKFKKYRNDTRTLRNVDSLSDKFEPFDNEEVQKEFVEKLKSQFDKSNIEIVDYPTLNIKDIFRSYFEKRFPFGSGGKKSEFPDAFALKSIELWAEENNVKVLAFSKDKDMLNYSSTHLEIIEDFELWLSDKIKEIEGKYHQKRLDEIEDFIKNKSNGIQQDVANWVNDQLDDYTKYYEYSNYLEVHDLSIVEVKTDIEDYNITNVSEDYISVELKMYVNYKVEIIIDDEDYMIKDYDTKEWLFMDTKPLLIDEIRYIDIEIVFETEPDDETIYEPEIETFNNGKNLNV